METTANRKTISLDLVGLDGNAFSLIGDFRRQAKAEGWTPAKIKAVTDEVMAGDYDHLLNTLMDHCCPVDEDGSGDDGYEHDEYGGVFDGFTVTSDADPGL